MTTIDSIPRGDRLFVIALAGNVGVGKLSLAQMLARDLGCPFPEDGLHQNPYLSDFNKNMDAWAFHSQLYILMHRAKKYMEVVADTAEIAILDRTIYEDAEVFARVLYELQHIDPRDYQTYREIYELLRGVLPPPGLVVYLRASITTLEHRIARQEHQNRHSLPTHFLGRLNNLYEEWAARYDLGPITTITVDTIDWENDAADYRLMAKNVLRASTIACQPLDSSLKAVARLSDTGK